ncbi:NDP-sugar epimerase, includes UDP-GlcNAc-inverting 4,6-dehydratase FlaA1 and capsular polysaccharide biosynthesis protein EpsC [Modicisalibacter ilicicola DSM 19980]|uniref:NDP-sugar epimerase, includes UDP-GlcNAc-inverting 4,6-dehydratase FlaA1 and capsular polysaccharide biosynthesis protein EpsC n=1 Tax=Modicisalibacter ilicicola DSM 19980 TaxID=1121942 RepID=A0A1M5BZ25_9GAMM|nr:nucleoside-diphosphate sugar epimerase/dehydratase [Halomonas ilicicola]SHF47660.1 NDP-sugar epimerase, includes UDP-GlcNAc-inverting 4,6-dehydratase FlaA1 and capsular polysaccharide biosynthesis protein EpsC [Halomonas ilicicola DSM 19980]
MLSLFRRMFRLPRTYKRIIQVLVDTLLLTTSFILAMLLRLDSWTPLYEERTWLMVAVLIPLSLLIFVHLGFYRAVVRYMSQKALHAILLGVLGSAAAMAIISYWLDLPIPRSVPIIYAMLALLTIGGVRAILRGLYQRSLMRHKTCVAIYGAGAAGSQLVASLRHGQEYVPVCFIDDWRGMRGTLVEGLKVYAPSELPRLIKEYGVKRVLLAMPSASLGRRREILKMLEPLAVPVQTVPGMADVIAGRARINEIRDVTVEDLLGRDPVPPNQALLDANIRDKVVLVTGAGGSIGSELCRQVLQQRPRRLILFEVCEYSLYQIEKELLQFSKAAGLAIPIKALLGSVQQRQRLEGVMRAFRVQTIYHAAAYKHVPLVEHNAIEGIRNNVFGTLETAKAAMACQVETFVLVSTDKAVRPTNVMGTTKRLAELICQAFAREQHTTRFCMVRFGNVLGSSGSVVPLFRKQIREGGPITVTHPDITRYFMTIPEAAQLVIQAGAMGNGGDVFVLNMGEPVRISDLAKHMVRLSGLEVLSADSPEGDIEIVYTGLRPGEKLFEELLIGDDVTDTAHPRIMAAHESHWEWSKLEGFLQQLQDALIQVRHDRIRELLLEAPAAYHPQEQIADLVWIEEKALPAYESEVDGVEVRQAPETKTATFDLEEPIPSSTDWTVSARQR